VVVIVWLLNLQLPVQSVPMTTKIVSSNDAHGGMYLIQHYVIKFVSDLIAAGRWISLGTTVSSTNKTDATT
jgi:hypothetical protein